MRKNLSNFLFLTVILAVAGCYPHQDSSLKMLVGTYTDNNDSHGVYLFDFNENDATFSLLDTAKAGNPSFIIPSADKRFAWSVGEYEDGSQCAVSYSLSDCTIDVLNRQPTDGEASGAAPCL